MWSSSSIHHVLQDSGVELCVGAGWGFGICLIYLHHRIFSGRWDDEIGREGIMIVYECACLSFLQQRSPATVCSPEVTFLGWVDMELASQTPNSSTEGESATNLQRFKFQCWMDEMRCMLVYSNSLFPRGLFVNQFPWMTHLGSSIPCSSTSSIQVQQFSSVVADI